MLRTFFLPVVLMAMVGFPMLYQHHQSRNRQAQFGQNGAPNNPWALASSSNTYSNSYGSPRSNSFNNPYWSANSQSGNQFGLPVANSQFPPTRLPTQQIHNSQGNGFLASAPLSTAPVAGAPFNLGSSANPSSGFPPGSPGGFQPDFGKTETYVFRGDANGPDLSQPVSFNPVVDLGSLFRFNISEQEVLSRWDRVSTTPTDNGLHGLRVPLVTGTNSWDLHGSMTWFYDANHQLQRITYRGWTGDPTRLLQILGPQYGFQPQPTHLAGLYLAGRNKSGLIMKRPVVIDKSNPVQQMALILELNNPRSRISLSENFSTLLPAARAGN